MISVVLYGRNDSYGYNLHKRAALSLNCIAELLTHEADEILFVDYNTPDDFPTFPEAIQDTLTERARRLLRILRVRPKHHQWFRDRTHLVALEPVARNVAVRRSNPDNRWILSTNTDMIFVPRQGQSLSQIAADLPDGLYHLPRFEIPESLWESLDRMNPLGAISAVAAWGRDFHLNEIVHAQDPWVKFDAPGDFQLLLRSDLFRISGFNEEMLLGWHVDSNIARRLHLLHGETRDLLDRLWGYHCDHTRQVTPMHRSGGVQNDLGRFNDEVDRPDLPEQAATWGFAGEVIEELTVSSTGKAYFAGLSAAVTSKMTEPSHAYYTTGGYDRVDYSVPHVLPFVADIFASYPRDALVGWFASRRDLLEAFAEAFRKMGFERDVLVGRGATWIGQELPRGCAWMDPGQVVEKASVFVFDCWLPPAPADTAPEGFNAAGLYVAAWFRRAVRAEVMKLAADRHAPRRFIAVNAIHNRFETMVASHINAARSPMASRIRQGFANTARMAGAKDLLPLFSIGPAGRRDAGRIVSQPGKAGFVIFGPYLSLDAGSYCLTLKFQAPPAGGPGPAGIVAFEVVGIPYILSLFAITRTVQTGGAAALKFRIGESLIDIIPWLGIEFRIRTEGLLNLSLTGAVLEQIAAPADDIVDYELLPLLTRGLVAEPAEVSGRAAGFFARRDVTVDGVRAAQGQSGYVVYGPCLAMPPGRYEARFALAAANGRRDRRVAGDAAVAVEVVANVQIVERRHVDPRPSALAALTFEVPAHEGPPDQMEFRVWTDGTLDFTVRAVSVRRID